ncbi:HAD family hydrolase [Calycomorphotria hydatis]|uniref:Alpha-D-glucose-1-phosphate phosphatase YihX n=1 Tax=Calycomorphotria hydatis TaxID=2528027 RepID=A0A517T4S2_9PLAN|nr:HAD family phosphatase [Calycomorphotria hydatis]QDT63364.1 Alpha-D-glucose-1-phosphate phosphatase YihX [Calycomorphotria hydatis]
MPIRAILCDLGNVLLDFSHERMCRQLGEVLSLPESHVQKFLFSDGWQKRIETGACSDEELLDAFIAEGGTNASLDDLRVAAADIFTPNEDSIQIIHELREAGLRLVLFSNTCPQHIDFIAERYDVLSLFDHCIYSYEVGASKPSPQIYSTGIEACRCTPEEIFYTDDIADYIKAAREHGIQAEQFTSAEEFRSHLIARDVLPN